MAWWYNTPSQTITVWEDPPERQSLVLNAYGEPYIIQTTFKMGFDLTPKEYNNARKAKGETCFPLQEG